MEPVSETLQLIDRFGVSLVFLTMIVVVGGGCFVYSVRRVFGPSGLASDAFDFLKQWLTELKDDHNTFLSGTLENQKITAETLQSIEARTRAIQSSILILVEGAIEAMRDDSNLEAYRRRLEEIREELVK
jgi:hypothetical protein